MEVVLALFGIALALGVPLVGLISGLVSWSRIKRLAQQVEALELAQLQQRAELQLLRAQLDKGRVPAAASQTSSRPGAVPEALHAAVNAVASLQQLASQNPTGTADALRDSVSNAASNAMSDAVSGGMAKVAPQGASGDAPNAATGGISGDAAGAGAPPPGAPPRRPPLPEPPSKGPGAAPISVEWLITRLAAALGGFSVLLGAIFALSAAIDRGWIGPGLRVGVALVFGTALAWRGATLRMRGLSWSGAGLLGAGQGALYGAIFAAASLYHLLGQVSAFAALCALTGLGMALASRLRDPVSASLSLIGGLLTPVLLSTGENNALGLFSYLALLTGGAVFVALRRGWAPLLLAAAIGAVALFLGWTERYRAPDQLPAAVLALAALAAPIGVAGLLERRAAGAEAPGIRGAAFAALVGIALAGLPWVMPIDPEFFDPRTGQAQFRPLGAAPLWSAAATVLLPVPAVLVGRAPALAGWSRALPLVAGVLSLAFTAAHANAPGVGVALLGVGLLGPLGCALALQSTRAEAAGALAPLLMGLVAAATLGATDTPAAGLVLLACGAPLVAALILGARAPFGALAAVVGLAAVGLVGAARIDRLSAPEVLGAGAIAAGVLGSAPLRWPRAAVAGSPWPWAAAALATPAVFLPMLTAWQAHLGAELRGMLPVGLAMVPLLGTMTLVRVHGVHRGSGVLALFFGVTIAGLTAAVPLQLKDQWLTVAWALEGAALALVSRRLTHPLVSWSSFALAMAVSVRLVLNPYALEYGDTGGVPVLNWTLYTWGVPLVCVLASVRWLGPQLRGDAAQTAAALPDWARHGLVLAAVAVGFALVNVQVSDLFQDAGPVELGGHGLLQGMVRSLAWAAYGVMVLSIGMGSDSKALRLVGFGLVMLAALKVFASDLWSLSGFARVGSVMGLGATLLLAAFLFERLVLRRQRAQAASEDDLAHSGSAAGEPGPTE